MIFECARLFAAVVAFSHLPTITAIAFNGTSESPAVDPMQTPRFVLYSDEWVPLENGPPQVSEITGFNVFILSFLLSGGPADQALEWADIDQSTRSTIKSQYNDAGIKLIVSAFGATDAPTSAGRDPTALARQMASFVKDFNLDGIDVDYEDFGAFDAGTAVDWVIEFTAALREELPASQYIISHAPVAPWKVFSAGTGSPYVRINNQVGNMIDWYNVQFYNQNGAYLTCSTIVFESGSPWPKSSIFEIAATGVPLNKVVLGKPANAPDANSGFVDPDTLATCVQQAKDAGWSAGVMVWEYPHAAASWISTVRSKSWPV